MTIIKPLSLVALIIAFSASGTLAEEVVPPKLLDSVQQIRSTLDKVVPSRNSFAAPRKKPDNLPPHVSSANAKSIRVPKKSHR